MFRRFLFLSVGAFALLAALGAPGQLHAQGMRGGFSLGVRPMVNPGFRGGMFDPRFNGGFFNSRFRGGMFDPRFNGGFFAPGFSPGFRPGFFRPF